MIPPLFLKQLSSVSNSSVGNATPRSSRGAGGNGNTLLLVICNVVALLFIAHESLSRPSPVALATSSFRGRGHVPVSHAAHGETFSAVDAAAPPLAAPRYHPIDSCDSTAAPPHFDADAATAVLRGVNPTAYEKGTTYCEDLGPACVQGGEYILYAPRFQPANGKYDAGGGELFQRLAKLMYTVTWGGGGSSSNPDVFSGNLKRFDSSVVRAWPAGLGATPPVPFSNCSTPLVLYWDFPENYYHSTVAFASLWHAVRTGAVSPNVTIVLGLPQPPTSAVSLPAYLTSPLEAMGMRGGITTLRQLGSAARSADGGAAAGASLPPTRCFARLPVCSIATYSQRPPKGLLDYLHAVADTVMGRPPNWSANSTRVHPYPLLPASKPFAVSPLTPADAPAVLLNRGQRRGATDGGSDRLASPSTPSPAAAAAPGVLRVTLALRSEGIRRVLNVRALLTACAATRTLTIKGAPVPVVCSLSRFGGAGGLAADVAAMQATDVLVAVHGAGLTNMGFLRPGALVVEVRPSAFDPANADRFYRPLARDSGSIKWWGLLLYGNLTRPGGMEAARVGNVEKWGRDKDVVVPWPALASAISSASQLSWWEWAAADARGETTTDATAVGVGDDASVGVAVADHDNDIIVK